MSTQQDEVTILAQAVNRLSEDLAECTMQLIRYKRALERIARSNTLNDSTRIALETLNP